MVSSTMQSLLDLRVVPEGTSHHQIIQQALQLLQEGFKAGCGLERKRKRDAKGGRKGGRGK